VTAEKGQALAKNPAESGQIAAINHQCSETPAGFEPVAIMR